MVEHPVLRSQANEVFGAMLAIGLNPADFEWGVCQSSMAHDLSVSILCRRGTPFFFVFDFNANKQHWSKFSPGREKHIEEENSGTWDQQCQTVKRWLEYLKREVSSTDLWASVSRETAIVAAQDAENNTPFLRDEIDRVAASIGEIREYVRTTQQLNEAHMRFVEARLGYLAEATQRMGRKDWINMAVGVFTNIVVGVAMNPERAREFFQFIGAALAWAFSGQLLLPR